MLVLTRYNGQWVDVTHRQSGDVIRIRVFDIFGDKAKLAFDDKPRNFEISRPESVIKGPSKS